MEKPAKENEKSIRTLAELLRAVVTLESQHEAVYQLAVEVAKIVPQYCSAAVSSNDVVKMLNAFGHVMRAPLRKDATDKLLNAHTIRVAATELGSHLVSLFASLSPEDFVYGLWSVAACDALDHERGQAYALELSRRASSLAPNLLVIGTQTLCKANVRCPTMLAKTVELCLGSALLTGNLQLVTQPRSFSADLLASVARSLAVIDFHHGAFQHAMFTWAQKYLGIYSSGGCITFAEANSPQLPAPSHEILSTHGFANLLWSWAVADTRQVWESTSLLDCVHARIANELNRYHEDELTKLAQYALWSHEERAASGLLQLTTPPGSQCLDSKLPEKVRDFLQNTFCAVSKKNISVTSFSKNAFRALTGGFPEYDGSSRSLRRISNLQGSKEQVQHEVVLPMGYVVDILIGKELVIELDGPKHFSSDRYPLGSTLLKRRQLKAQGYKVISVPYWEWDILREDGGKQRRFLLETVQRSL